MKAFFKKLILTLGFLSALQVSGEATIDLSSLTMKNAKQPYAKIITGGQPSLADLKRLKKLGITRIVNLRTQKEFTEFNEAEEAKQLGISYVAIEVAGAAGVSISNARKLNQALKQSDELTLVHCASSNRVGALFALIASGIEGKNLEQSLVEGQKAGLKSLYKITKKQIENMQ